MYKKTIWLLLILQGCILANKQAEFEQKLRQGEIEKFKALETRDTLRAGGAVVFFLPATAAAVFNTILIVNCFAGDGLSQLFGILMSPALMVTVPTAILGWQNVDHWKKEAKNHHEKRMKLETLQRMSNLITQQKESQP